MLPKLGKFIANGPSRHRLRKGLLVISSDGKREANSEEISWLINSTTSLLASQPDVSDFVIEPDSQNPSVIFVVTPLFALHSLNHRNIFFQRLESVLGCVLSVAKNANLVPLGAGVNPFSASTGNLPALCSDTHEIEIVDEIEINRIYNLFRQYLPELIAISTHSVLYGGQLQKDLSTRMRLNPASFTPPSLALFSHSQLDRLKRSLRKDYGLKDLTQLDVNPISTNSITLRFVDAQTSLRFIRAQILLFQAISIHGRTLARQGSQTPTLHSRIIGANKALAIEAGPAAVFRPDQKREVKRRSSWYQDQKVSERASTALLQALDHQTVDDNNSILQALKTLRASFDELEPIFLGAELRKRGESCLVNYGEYQMRLFHLNRAGWQKDLLEDYQRALTDSSVDLLCEYNEKKFPEQYQAVKAAWKDKLWPFDRKKKP